MREVKSRWIIAGIVSRLESLQSIFSKRPDAAITHGKLEDADQPMDCLNAKSKKSACVQKLSSTETLIQRTTTGLLDRHMYYIGLDVHKKTISYCIKDVSGQVHQEGKIGATRHELDGWIKTLPQPWSVASPRALRTCCGLPISRSCCLFSTTGE